MCIFLRSKLYFAGMKDLISLTCLAADHMGCDNYAAIYANQ